MKKYLLSILIFAISFSEAQASENLSISECENRAGWHWSADYHRCIKDQEVVTTENQFHQCLNLQNDPVAYENCLATQAAGTVWDDKMQRLMKQTQANRGAFITGNPAMVLNSTSLMMGLSMYLFKKKQQCPAKSYKLIKMAGMLGAGADIANYVLTRKGLKKLQQDYQGLSRQQVDLSLSATHHSDQTHGDNIIKAMDFQIDQVKLAASDHLRRSVKNALVAGLYTTAAAMALYELSGLDPAGGVFTGLCFNALSQAKEQFQNAPAAQEFIQGATQNAVNNAQSIQNISLPTTGVPQGSFLSPLKRQPHLYQKFYEFMDQLSPTTHGVDFNLSPRERESFALSGILETLQKSFDIAGIFKKATYAWSLITIAPAYAQQTSGPQIDLQKQLNYREKTEGYASWEQLTSSAINVAASAMTRIGGGLGHPTGRLVLASSAAALATTVAITSGTKHRIAKNRYQKLEHKREQLTNAIDSNANIYACTDAMRLDPGQPQCYCYTESGEPRPGIENISSACCRRFGTCNQYVELPQTLANTQSDRHFSPCYDQNGNYDPQCLCRQNNTCNGLSTTTQMQNMLGGLSWFDNFLGQLNGTFNGNLASGGLQAGSFLNGAMKLQEALQEKVDAYNRTAAKDQKPTVDLRAQRQDFLDAAGKALVQDQVHGSGGAQVAGPLLASLDPMLSKVPSKKSTAQTSSMTGQGSYVAGKGKKQISKKRKPFSFQFQEQSSTTPSFSSEKKYNYGDHAIIKNSEHSIWSILSHRYSQSGMERLFTP